MTATVEHIAGQTFHGRRGEIENAFRYSVDYVLVDAEAALRSPALFGRNRRNFFSLNDRDHGGAPGEGAGPAWVRRVLRDHAPGGFDIGRILLLAQPRVLGHVFNPVSFWLVEDTTGAIPIIIAEVTNTFGDRHSYICHHDDLRPIGPGETLSARKIFHVSPFQEVAGDYTFKFDIRPDKIGIWIDYRNGDHGLLATLTGNRAPLTNGAILRAALRRPFGSRRVLGLIHWQALKLWWKGAVYNRRPHPPVEEVSR